MRIVVQLVTWIFMRNHLCHNTGTARATALMVKLGLLNLVRDIVANLSKQDRADVVSQVSENSLSM